ncbi:hypothetical protein E3N88_28638 [Mikania micrantha]|uniref:Uncharacterized protein n=1 Tax=Mikania micrantha TaxID=192012 RepID=A0A5N6N164_9ASTR|nr:hypothetical protein E3N88_28638 [Mikania micrantha]
MDQNQPNIVDCETSTKKNKTTIVWDGATFKEFINACIVELRKDFANFRDANLDIYETHYAPLFRDCVAIRDQTMSPLQFQKTTNPNEFHEEVNIKGKGINVEVNLDGDEDIFNNFMGSNSCKRKKSREAINRSTKSKTSSFEEKLDVVLDALTSKSTQKNSLNNPSPTISDCMKIVIAFPDFNEAHGCMSKFVQESFNDSGETIHKHLHIVLAVVLKMSADIIKPPVNFNDEAEEESYNPTEIGSSNEVHDEGPTTHRTNINDLYMAAVRDIIAQEIIESQV